jgi:hypothetical protein
MGIDGAFMIARVIVLGAELKGPFGSHGLNKLP